MVVLEEVERTEHVGRIANENSRGHLAARSLAGKELTVDGSIGISLYPEDGATREDLIFAAYRDVRGEEDGPAPLLVPHRRDDHEYHAPHGAG